MSSNFHYFPEDLLLDVLSRLPLKTLAGFRLVSKSWRDLIESRSLSKMYLDRLGNSSSNHSKIIICGYRKTSKLYAMDCSTNAVKELHYPLKDTNQNKVRLLGSSNGVLCLRYAYPKIVLWNPLSLKYWELCWPQFSSGPNYFFGFVREINGFGYDKINDDYKVVALLEYFDDRNQSVSYEGWTYSLKLKRWKRTENFSYGLRFHSYRRISLKGIIVSGALHWITRDRSLLAFDLADEKFRVVPEPPNYHSDDVFEVSFGVFGDCLSLTCLSRTRNMTMWVMKDSEDSWTLIKGFKVAEHPLILSPIGYLECNSRVILHDFIDILSYDLEKQSLQIVAQHLGRQAYPYLETLEYCYI